MVTQETKASDSPRLAAVKPNKSQRPEAGPATHELLRAQIRQLIQAARARGEPKPGRPKLMSLTGAKDHQVREALKLLSNEEDESASIRGPKPAGPPRSWPLLLMALGAAVLIWTGWVELARLTGFGLVRPLPGIWDSLQINSAVVLPISLEAYGSYALRCWLAPPLAISQRTRRFAQRSAAASLVLGGGAQVICHLLKISGATVAPAPIVIFVACVPVAVLGAAAALARLVANDRHELSQSPPDTEPFAAGGQTRPQETRA